MQRNAVIKALSLTQKQIEQFDSYEALLKKWQPVQNLVGPKTLEFIWERHFYDSSLLLSLLENKKSLADCGTGAGFPGLVLALLKPDDFEVHLIESNQRKCAFLREVIRVTGAKATVHMGRVEEKIESLIGKADCVTARALAPLSDLVDMTYPLLKTGAEALFLKGERGEEEIADLKQTYDFNVELFKSLTQDLSYCVRLSVVQQK